MGGRYIIHRITNQEAKYKLCRVRQIKTGPKNVPYLYTSDGRTIRYPDPVVKANDSIRLDINTNKIMDSIKFEAGNLCMVTGVRNTGRVGTIMHRERHPGSFDIVHVKDALTPSPLVWVTSLLLARATSLTSACLRVTESSCPLLRSVTSVWQGLKNLVCFSDIFE